jgi:hypothetical protein
MIEEELYHVEPPEANVIRHNTDAICHLATAYSAADQKAHSKILLDLMEAHSNFLLNTSKRILMRHRFYIEEVMK